ncbi:MAG: hypothetical protein KA270_11530 [Saprospiraceae bacterium]|jgi:hypothetical protein|nr:hypothetical protein [Saprospiraceae bacterium]MBP6567792.1 hypothetical protein [Saprospiraceae bacterium]
MRFSYTQILIVAFFLLSYFNASAQFQFGGGMKFNTNNQFKALGLNAKIGKDISEKFDINVDVAYYLATKASWSFDFNLHYRLFNLDDKLILNPTAGINFTRTDYDKDSNSVLNNSLNLGVSLRVPTDKYTYYIEPQWILDNGQFVFSVGVLYPTISR